MKQIKRWTLSLSSWVDGVLGQIENHEASVSAAVGRIRQSAARARAQLKRVERDQRGLRDSLSAEREAAEAWKRRAKTAVEPERALECMRRYKTSERRIASLRQRLDEHERAHKELCEGVRLLDARLGELIERKNLMRTRQSRAEAANGMASTTGPIGDLEDVFERWEIRVGEIEIASDCEASVDTFEAEFEVAEEETALRLELEELRLEES